jgi:Sporulation and spore germination
MIPRYQRVLFWALLVTSVAMAVVLIRLRERAADRISAQVSGRNAGTAVSEAIEPATSTEENITLLEANDADDSIAPVTRMLALPQETGARARVLLRQLLADYTAPESKHPLGAGPGVEEVFFMDPLGSAKPTPQQANGAGQTAIVNLTSAFAENHPSGIEPETLTLLSIIGTLHENFPAIERVRFLVDGQPRETLAGHADLTRTYLAGTDQANPER